jgi:hypothetical protein
VIEIRSGARRWWNTDERLTTANLNRRPTMARNDSTTDKDRDRNPEPPPSLRAIIEGERVRLLKACSVLGCTSIALDYDDGSDPRQPDYAHVVDVVRDLIQEVTARLDFVNLAPFYEKDQVDL